VPITDRVGQENEGWTIAKYLLGHERSSAAGVASAKRQMAKLRRVAAAESVGGRTLMEDADFRRRFTEIELDVRTLEMTSLRVLAGASADRPIGAEASVLKLGMSNNRQAISELMMQAGAYYAHPYHPQAIRGGWNEEPIGPDYLFRMAPEYFEMRARTIAGGSNEVQKNIIAKRTLGL
jgi:alkylation response protein AidB-like acyl-CoA dehydrogenase